MENSVLFNNPVILIGYIVALAIAVVALIKKPHWSVSIISVLLFAAVTTYALLLGAPLYEVGAVAALFFIVQLLPLCIKEGK